MKAKAKDTQLKSNRPNMHMLDYESSDDESKEVYAANLHGHLMIKQILVLLSSQPIRVSKRK
jgi:hypothetical protein